MPLLQQALQHRSVEMRKAAARALGRIGPQSIVALPALVKALGDRDDDV